MLELRPTIAVDPELLSLTRRGLVVASNRDRRAADLHRAGVPYTDIAERLGFPDTRAAHRGVAQALAEPQDAHKVANEWLMRPRGAYVMGRNMFGPNPRGLG